MTETTRTTTIRPARKNLPQTRRLDHLTFETPVLLGALLLVLAVGVSRPEIAMILLGIPFAIATGVGVILGTARLLAR